MSEEIKKILFQLEIVARKHTIKVTDTGNVETMPANVVDELRLNNYSAKILLNYITNLQKENTDLKKLCNKYEEEHKTTFETWKKVIARSEKAVELIKKALIESDITGNGTLDINNLLSILQGGDE
jgi:hypothetical protein